MERLCGHLAPYFVIRCDGEMMNAVSTGKYSRRINAVLNIKELTSQATFLSILILWCSFMFSFQSTFLLPQEMSLWEVFEPYWSLRSMACLLFIAESLSFARTVCQAVPQDCLETSTVSLAWARLQVIVVWIRRCLAWCLTGGCSNWKIVEASTLPTSTVPRSKKCYQSPN